MADENVALGSCVVAFGAVLSLTSYLIIGSVPLTAMGIGLIVVGAAWALTPSHPLPREVVGALVRSSCSNIEALLEALGATKRAVYIPLRGGKKVVAYIPIKGSGNLTVEEIAENEGKVIVNRGGSFGVLVSPPTASLRNPHPIEEGLDVQSVLEHALVDSEVAASVKFVVEGNDFVVEIKKPRIDVDHPRFKLVMGSLPSSIAAQAIALATSKPTQIVSEKRNRDRLIVHVRALNWTERDFT
ncbi:MAG: hypothetical protein QXQ20_08415 [Candidatus Nezhaarchaeales archaeon]